MPGQRTFHSRTFNTVSYNIGTEAIVVFRIGQSNSSGAALNSTLDPSFQVAFPNIKTFNGSSYVTLDQSLNNNQYPSPTAQGASEFALLTKMQAHYGGTIYDVKYGISGSSLGSGIMTNPSWDASLKGTPYDLATRTLFNALMTLKGMGFGRFKVFIFWDQGEADAQNVTYKNNYSANFTLVANGIDGILNFFKSAKIYYILPELNQNIYQINTTSRAITGATNANPIVITTNGNHALLNGQYVQHQNVLGNTAANGSFQITYISATQYSIPVAGNGVYTSGGNINAIYWKSDIQSQARTFVASRPIGTAFSYVTDSFGLQADGIHYTNLGYKNKGDYPVPNIIIPNNL